MEITVETHIKASLETVWEAWTTPAILQDWNGASIDWYCPKAEVDLHEGGKFFYRIERVDGSEVVDFEGVFKRLKLLRLIEYRFNDGRKVSIHFKESLEGTEVFETIELDPKAPEIEQTAQHGHIMTYFKKIVETNRLLS
ncbi:hypothetical protein MGA5115_03346 [Marinomonas gallaica]|uniref:Activator of Hsp90 ATPase homologue 1/2-like C-terminal domain-containing protein n=1 Tax=Marinomonas gallaica TaxID=1806667 RepID=A0A1C3JVB7_9GAMM|nr:SRPBCC domain-containing protein [Marinomonas gallaica]SBT19184.1 hypothetical protein MGA5115_03346 [Marinomonas gallaica]SBT20873.1 hypothetical protein MGA5116_01460 [Marinomonas gallaica]